MLGFQYYYFFLLFDNAALGLLPERYRPVEVQLRGENCDPRSTKLTEIRKSRHCFPDNHVRHFIRRTSFNL